MSDGKVNLQGLLEFDSNRPWREILHLSGVADDKIFCLLEDETGVGFSVFDFRSALMMHQLLWVEQHLERRNRRRWNAFWGDLDLGVVNDLSAQVEHSDSFSRLFIDGCDHFVALFRTEFLPVGLELFVIEKLAETELGLFLDECCGKVEWVLGEEELAGQFALGF